MFAKIVVGGAASAPFFPPWYFWVFVLAVVITIASAVVALVFVTKRAESEQRIKERELAAHLIEVMLTQRKMSPAEIDQVLSSYWRLGTFWHRFRHWFSAERKRAATDLGGEKAWQFK